jgi:hypothetical protein
VSTRLIGVILFFVTLLKGGWGLSHGILIACRAGLIGKITCLLTEFLVIRSVSCMWRGN